MADNFAELVRAKPVQKKKTVLIVDDDPIFVELIQDHAETIANSEVVVATNFSDALKVMFDKDREIGGVILDNGFPLTQGGQRVGKARFENTGNADEVKQGASEGGAGAMLLRFMRSGETGAQREAARSALDGVIQQVKADAGEEYENRLKALQSVPVVWHSASPEVGKVAGIREVVKGRLIPGDARYSDSSVRMEPGQMDVVDRHTACGSKAGFTAVKATVAFIEKGIEQGRACAAGG